MAFLKARSLTFSYWPHQGGGPPSAPWMRQPPPRPSDVQDVPRLGTLTSFPGSPHRPLGVSSSAQILWGLTLVVWLHERLPRTLRLG